MTALYLDACPECGRYNNVPVVVTPATHRGPVSGRIAEQVVCRYVCACSHTWTTSWSGEGTEGRLPVPVRPAGDLGGGTR